jgi:peptidoglycan/LPS O-acetylase OafA/YrhL
VNPNLEPTQLQQDSSTTGRHIPALDGIRGLAILLVFMDHFLWSNPDVRGPWIVRLGSRVHGAGWIGVDLFFVLSGFLITGILYDTLKAPRFFRNFYARRALRIFPLYYGFLLLLFLGTLLTGGHWDSLAAIKLLTYTENLAIHPTGASISASWFNINHFWSLAIEEQFYFFWPLMVFFCKTKRRIVIAASCGALASLLTRILLTAYGVPNQNPYVLYSWTPAHLDGLFFGAILAMAVRSHYRNFVIGWSRVAFLVSAAACVVFTFIYPDLNFLIDRNVAIWGFLLLAITFTTLIALALRPHGLANHFFSTAPMRFFGKYSYGLYIFHYSIARLAERFRPAIVRHTHSKLLGVLLPAFVGLAVSIGVAWLSFNFYEKKFLALKSRFHDSTPTPKLHDLVPES